MWPVTLHLQDYIRSIPDFPEPGILFRDFSPLLMDAGALRQTITQLAEVVAPLRPDYLVGPEARGFVFGPAVAQAVGAAFVIELRALGGRDRLAAHVPADAISCLIEYP